MGARPGALNSLIVDTHVLAWVFKHRRRLSQEAIACLELTEEVIVSSASLYEIAYKVQLGKWEEMRSAVPSLVSEIESRSYAIRSLDAAIMLTAGRLDWPHRDPFDRMIAATAIALDLPLLSADAAFDTCPAPIRRIW